MEFKFDKPDSEAGMLENAKFIDKNIDKYFEWNLSKFPFKMNQNILDLGCGPCSYFNCIMKYEPNLYYATDYSDVFLNEVQKLVENRVNCKIKKLDLLDFNTYEDLFSYKFDILICFDVIEHIDNDVQVLENIRKLMQKTGSGVLCIKVPALQSIYGVNDYSVGHYRRYNIKSLKKAVNNAGLKIVEIKYHNIFGIIPWWFIGKILKRKVALTGGERSSFDLLVPFFKFMEKFIPPPIGLSLNCICKIDERNNES